jgi:hypothetical protein
MTYYLFEPESPPIEYLGKLQQILKRDGYSLSLIPSGIADLSAISERILSLGMTALLRGRTLLTEEVLPDSTPRSEVEDTLRYKLKMMNAENTLHIIDPYIYPRGSDADYLDLIFRVFAATFSVIRELHICTAGHGRDAGLETAFLERLAGSYPNVTTIRKYSQAFHDRFWIADGQRGTFIGTSLNGVGRRYAVIDCLQDVDTEHLINRYNQLA